MKLGELIRRLRAADPAKVVENGFGRPTSYRGYYDQVAFVPAPTTTIGEMLEHANLATERPFHGYKGGAYTYDLGTEAWVAEWGCCAPNDEPISESDVARWTGDAIAEAAGELLRAAKVAIIKEADNADEGYSAGLHRAAEILDEAAERAGIKP